ncbi:hypothetical protein GGI25_000629 [Coemansia spiralis]|uniref:RED-like N-terminal domain-containing protein n=2 Tax=Coemansia TaxID=4863 RepID=A0A9W8GBS4_9FUNG|nr:hypothetical protein EDC05_000453 [Coemansia umbellata]KAJ2625527.1 hypothetical protein GGI26_000668 [Coemansia sp. RSA 1358]KAJ2680655.1 hypothetical protein GGI25_000629 [Coemansia spiralis]
MDSSDNGAQDQAHGLSQSDFRTLLQTPSQPSQRKKGILGAKVKAKKNLHRTPIVAKPTTLQRDNGKTANNKKYRDRAAERRQGLADESLPVGSEVSREESKFLGGDFEHTHLVRGLDYLLLNKVRADAHDGLDDELERLHQGGPIAAGEEDSRTLMGQRVLSVLKHRAKQATDVVQHLTNVKPNDMFAPGRMYFEFDTSLHQPLNTVIAARIRSQDEISQFLETRPTPHYSSFIADGLVISKVVNAIAASREKKKNKKKSHGEEEEERQKEEEEEEKAMAGSSVQPDKAEPELASPYMGEEEDIFADAGIDYSVTVAEQSRAEDVVGPPAPIVSGPSHKENYDSDVSMSRVVAVTAPYPDSGGSDDDQDYAVTAPYPDPVGSDNDQDYAVTAPYPESENFDSDQDYAVTAPYPNPEGSDNDQDYAATAPYPEPDENRENTSDHDDDGMHLFSLARSKFKEEVSGIGLHDTSNSNPTAQKRKIANATRHNDWHKTRRIMKDKYGIDIDSSQKQKQVLYKTL